MSIHRFIDHWNSPNPAWGSKSSAALVGEAVKYSFMRQFSNSRPHRFGLSQLGKPSIELIYNRYIDPSEDDLECGLRYIFSIGDYTEALLLAMMKDYGLDVHSEQMEVEVHNIQGHIDCFVGSRLIDIKSMSHTYFTSFTNKPDDERGYLTQLSLYALGCKKKGIQVTSCGFLCIDKSTGYLALVNLPKSVINNCILKAQPKFILLEEAELKFNSLPLEEFKKWAYTVDKPPTVPEKKGGVFTGKQLVPASMKLARCKYWAYNTPDGVYVE